MCRWWSLPEPGVRGPGTGGMTGPVTQLRVGDESFLVASMIERCPRIMMLRELVKNALEAAATAPEGQRLVRLSAVPISGVSKLAIWNSGRGMDAAELFRMCDIASSIRKEHRLDQNFGMGAKVASLPSNRHGLRYRSCHDGLVHEVLLACREGVYGRVRQYGSDGWADVVEVTAAALAEGRDIGADWTEVVLFGNASGQDTLWDPYGGAPPMPGHWLQEELTYRFFRIGDGVELLLERPGCRFEPLGERIDRDYTRHGTAVLPDGVMLHYVYDAPMPEEAGGSAAGRGALHPLHGACALVYKDELYDVHRWHDWLHVAPVFGIPFGARSITVLVELPDGYGVVPDAYRQFLRYAGDRQDEVSCRHFAPVVHRNRPDWLRALIDEQAPSARVSVRVYDELNRLLRELKVPRRRRAVPDAVPDAVRDAVADPPAGDEDAAEADAGGGAGSGNAAEAATMEAEAGLDVEPAPEILILREPHDVAARGVHERAARYYPETHQLFLNGQYAAVAEMQRGLLNEFAWAEDQALARAQALLLSEQSMAARVGRMLVFALSKQGRWQEHEVAEACSVQALSLAADDYGQSLDAARIALRSALAATG